MDGRLQTYKPAAPARVHLLLASVMWTVVGSVLLYFGIRWVRAGELPHAGWLLAAGIVVGLLKARFVLRRTARRIANRIIARGDGRCLGGFLSVRTWVFVLVMVTAGRLLRGGLLRRPIVGLIYAAVGVALLAGSVQLWTAWYAQRAGPENTGMDGAT